MIVRIRTGYKKRFSKRMHFHIRSHTLQYRRIIPFLRDYIALAVFMKYENPVSLAIVALE